MAILVKAHLAPYTSVARRHPNFGVLWLRIALPCRPALYLAGCYLPPQDSTYYKTTTYTLPAHFTSLQTDISSFSDRGHVVICGDMNARVGAERDVDGVDWSRLALAGVPVPPAALAQGCLTSTIPHRHTCDKGTVSRIGRRLLSLCQTHQLVILNGRLPGDCAAGEGGALTFHAKGREASSLIDYFLASPELAFSPSGRPRPGCSLRVLAPPALRQETDHACISVALPLSWVPRANAEQTHRARRRYQYRPDIVPTYLAELQARQDRLHAVGSQTHDVAASLEAIQCIITEAAEATHTQCGGVAYGAGAGGCPADRPRNAWYNAECKACRQRWRELQHTHGAHSAPARAAQRAYKNVVWRCKRAWADDMAERMVHQWKHQPKSFWGSYRDAVARCPLTDVDAWGTYFEALFAEAATHAVDSSELYGDPSSYQHNQASILNQPITGEEVQSAVAAMQSCKAPGEDGIPAEFLQCASSVLIIPLTRLFNRFLLDHFPPALSTSVIVPVAKAAGDPSNYDSYRGIAVGSAIAKLFSMVMNRRCDDWAEHNGWRASGQFGFRRGRSTVAAAYILRHVIDDHQAQGRPLFCAFIDFKKAYDSVDREALWRCLQSFGVHGAFLRCVQEMYSDVRLRVRIGERMSKGFQSLTGVKQGDPLSPLLFGLFIDCFEAFLARRHGHSVGAAVASKLLRVLLYADDLVLMADSAAELQELLESLSEFCTLAGMTVNVAKSVSVIFNQSHLQGATHSFTYRGATLPVEADFKYLGILFGSGSNGRGCVHDAYALQLVAGRRALHAMWRRCADLRIWNVRTLCYLFDALVKPVMSYGCEVWAPAVILACIRRGATYTEHEQLHIDFLRRAVGVRDSTPTSILMAELSRTPIWMGWLTQCVGFWNRVGDLPEGDLVAWCTMHGGVAQLDSPPHPRHQAPHGGSWIAQFSQCLIDLKVIRKASDLVEARVGQPNTLHYVDPAQVGGALHAWERTALQPSTQDPRGVTSSANFKLVTYSAWFAPHEGWEASKAFTSFLNNKVDIANVARMRMGSHNLNIETQRWGGKVPRAQRLCTCCDMDKVEDEKHFLLECPLYDALRATWCCSTGFTLAGSGIMMRTVVNWQSMADWLAFARYIKSALKLRDKCMGGNIARASRGLR